MRVHFAGMDGAAGTNELEQSLDVPTTSGRPGSTTPTGVHQPLYCGRHEAVVDEEVFVHIEAGVLPLEIAGTVGDRPMT